MSQIATMSQILGMKFAEYGQVYNFSSGTYVVREKQQVLVKTEQGICIGQVLSVRQEKISAEGVGEGFAPIMRVANTEDLKTHAENVALGQKAFRFCRKSIDQLALEMKLVEVEIYFDKSKIIFYFTSPDRIDFRDLIKDLVKEFRTRIELRQIGVRYEMQMVGALGSCGMVCCCRKYLQKFAPVTIKMAKEQNLFLNPAKISGVCGRLLCCLSYEQDGYEEFHATCPKMGKRFQTKSLGNVRVMRSNFFRRTITVLPENAGELEFSVDIWSDVMSKSFAEIEEHLTLPKDYVAPSFFEGELGNNNSLQESALVEKENTNNNRKR